MAGASSVLTEVPPPLPLPPLATPSLASLFPNDPSLTESSLRLSALGHEHPGHSVLQPAVAHRAPSAHGDESRRGGAGGSITRRVRTAQSEPDLGAELSSRPSTAGSSFRTVQPQALPRSFQVTERTPLFGVAAEHTQYRVEYDRLQKAWHKVLFPSLSPSSEKDVMMLEEWIDEMDDSLPPLKNFILPGGGLASAHLHHARSVCRRAERRVAPLVTQGRAEAGVGVYLNRLSDFFFVAARFTAQQEGHDDTVYQKNSSNE